jgi:proteic killer suppression protein
LLQLAFRTKKLRSVCEDAAYAEEVYGREIAAALVLRLADLRAAGSPLEVPFAEVRPPAGDIPAHIAVRLAGGLNLILAANHRTPPVSSVGEIAWEHVSRLLILQVE